MRASGGAGLKPASDSKKVPPPKRIKAGIAVWLVLLVIVIVTAVLATGGANAPEAERAWHTSLCKRKPLPTKRYYPAKPGGAFEDIPVVVFWNQNVHDDNRDAFGAVFGEYFPNMIFVGPVPRDYNSRTKDHMLDIWPISSTTYYTHRMLHAVVTEFPCYLGYLGARFDTFLNPHRLALFDQDKMWNTLPEAEPVLAETYDNEGKEHRDDWNWPWAFKPCLNAANASITNVKERWQRYHEKHFPGAPRLLRSMTDVTYIPHTKRSLVLEATPPFVDCFLEIGLPTFTAIALEGRREARASRISQRPLQPRRELDANPAGLGQRWRDRRYASVKLERTSMRQMLREEGERWGAESRRRR
ncbi:nucleotide-sugar transporter [Rhodotorula toruloides]|uniref:Nucleotide-sugar transporter n=1 Tax=Rhodotorula toruloides TaxID=5286 RepID=A0A511KM78_RHOTO|nr:nucleotide-sugar transporter [Rhodotorula toruloides]